jgi:hypothetical protein
MSSPTQRIYAISPGNTSGVPQATTVNNDFVEIQKRPRSIDPTFGAGIVVFVVLFSGTWILLISFAPGMVLVDDPTNKSLKIVSYSLAVMWSILISLIIVALGSLSIWAW